MNKWFLLVAVLVLNSCAHLMRPPATVEQLKENYSIPAIHIDAACDNEFARFAIEEGIDRLSRRYFFDARKLRIKVLYPDNYYRECSKGTNGCYQSPISNHEEWLSYAKAYVRCGRDPWDMATSVEHEAFHHHLHQTTGDPLGGYEEHTHPGWSFIEGSGYYRAVKAKERKQGIL